MSMPQAALPPTPDLAGLKTRQHATWASGDYALVGATLQIVGEELCEALDLRAGQRVLDVAAGNGNASLAAARRWCEVTSTDYVPHWLERGKARAAADGFAIAFQEADAEALPFAAASFDAVVSTYGVMFTPDQDRAAAEMLRVCRPGGKIGLANWTPHGFVGEMFKALGRYLPPPAGVKSPVLWGTRERLAELFGGAGSIRAEARNFMFRYRSPKHFLDVFGTCYGPVLKALAALDGDKRNSLLADFEALIDRLNRADDGTMVVPGEYLEVVVVKK
jgi:ubiquinone/menaquinone biosynthesis C-methylase UbiE